jgi:hypothetical protein
LRDFCSNAENSSLNVTVGTIPLLSSAAIVQLFDDRRPRPRFDFRTAEPTPLLQPVKNGPHQGQS